jgi:TolB-like protein/DNA-binding winged helix-turn-helix (wHTH) protein/Flp pilus assembly protein TadD
VVDSRELRVVSMPPTTPSAPAIRFGLFELDVRTGEPRKRGVRVPLQGLPVQLLIVMLENPGQIVTRDELRARLWAADTFVDFDHSLHNAVARLREALGEDANNPRFIETLPRRGYRFIAPVDSPVMPQTVTSNVAPRSRFWRAFAPSVLALVAVPAVLVGFNVGGVRSRLFGKPPSAHIDSIAVLPLKNLSDEREQDYFADGMTEALITDLGKVGALRVISRTSVMRYKDTKKPLPEIARELQVDALVEGTVARSGDRLRITANLVQASPERHLWAESYERDLRDVIALQNDVARTITQQIQVKLTPEEDARLTASHKVDPEAYKLFIKGRYFWVKRNRESFNLAMGYFQQAIDRDPGYAAPYSGLADCYALFGSSFDVGGLAPSEVQPKAKAAALKALELDSSLSDAHNSLAYVKLTYDWDWQGAEAEFKRSLELNPGYAHGHHWYAHLLLSSGRRDEALAESNRALELDPVSPIINLHLGWHYLYTRQYDRALDQLAKTLELDPSYALAHWYRGLAYEQKKLYPDALREMGKAKDLLPGNLAVQSDIAHVYAVSGDKGAVEKVIAGLREESARRYVNQYEVALIFVGLGRNDQAFEWLDKAFRGHSDQLVYLKVDPRLDSIRSDSRFTELVRRVGIPD